MDEKAAGAVAAMQFAAGRSIAEVAEEWERDTAWMEEAIRRTLLESIPRRDGGRMRPRAEARAQRQETRESIRAMQSKLFEEDGR
jgi:hypothetical protein